MAEVVGLVASVIGIAGAGVKLSRALRETVCDYSSAGIHVHDLATSITHFSHALRQIGQCLSDKNSPHSDDALETVRGVVKHCQAIYDELNGMVTEFRDGMRGKSIKEGELNARKRIQWIFKKSTVRYLTRRLDSEKSTLTMMLQILQLRTAMNDSRYSSVKHGK